jgi:Domain of unknown function (DUF1995)
MWMIQTLCAAGLLSKLAVTEAFVKVNPLSLSVWGEDTLGARHRWQPSTTSALDAAKCTPLPAGMSPFSKGVAKGLDIQGTFRKIAAGAITKALDSGILLLEIDIPPFVGGAQTKSQFDDFDNVQELNANRDFCVQLAPLLSSSNKKQQRTTWLVFPDDKECELAAREWTGQLYRKSTRYTSIRAACRAVTEASSAAMSSATMTTSGSGGFQKAWGATLAETVHKLSGGDGILADSSTLDALNVDQDRLALMCQPGNGGPVEDWINVQALHQVSSPQYPTIVVNGALDKVRDGYYPAIFFPALAKTVPFYRQFEAILVAKPIADKGLYGWLYRVYPEPWQVILQTTRTVPSKQGGSNADTLQVDDVVAQTFDQRPTFAQAVNALVQAAAKQKP